MQKHELNYNTKGGGLTDMGLIIFWTVVWISGSYFWLSFRE